MPVPVLVERFGAAGQHEAVRRLAATLLDAIDQNPSDSADHEEADRDPSQELSPVRLFLDGVAIGPVEGRPVYVETFSGPSFFRHGAAAVRQAALSKDSWILMVAQPHGSSRVDLERLGGRRSGGSCCPDTHQEGHACGNQSTSTHAEGVAPRIRARGDHHR